VREHPALLQPTGARPDLQGAGTTITFLTKQQGPGRPPCTSQPEKTMPYIIDVGTAVPEYRVKQEQCTAVLAETAGPGTKESKSFLVFFATFVVISAFLR